MMWPFNAPEEVIHHGTLITERYLTHMYHMDFGFPQGQNYNRTDENGRLITSIDGHREFLLIIDQKIRYICVKVVKNKLPPCKTVSKFLEIHSHQLKRNTMGTSRLYLDISALWGYYGNV